MILCVMFIFMVREIVMFFSVLVIIIYGFLNFI